MSRWWNAESIPLGVGRTRIAQWPVASGLGTVGGCRCLVAVVELHLVCRAQIGDTGLVARLAPASAIAHSGCMVHALGQPAGGTAVARIAVQRCTTRQLRFRNVVGGFCQCPLGAGRQVAPVVTRLAGAGSHHTVVHGD